MVVRTVTNSISLDIFWNAILAPSLIRYQTVDKNAFITNQDKSILTISADIIVVEIRTISCETNSIDLHISFFADSALPGEVVKYLTMFRDASVILNQSEVILALSADVWGYEVHAVLDSTLPVGKTIRGQT